MSKRFVLTEIFRKPDEDFGHIKNWYYKNGVIKRTIILYPDYLCDKFYDKEGRLHKENEPAIVASRGEMHFYVHGQRHRGHFEPAIIWSDGRKEYYVYGEKRFETFDLTKHK
jgi:hypothetical protein